MSYFTTWFPQHNPGTIPNYILIDHTQSGTHFIRLLSVQQCKTVQPFEVGKVEGSREILQPFEALWVQSFNLSKHFILSFKPSFNHSNECMKSFSPSKNHIVLRKVEGLCMIFRRITYDPSKGLMISLKFLGRSERLFNISEGWKIAHNASTLRRIISVVLRPFEVLQMQSFRPSKDHT